MTALTQIGGLMKRRLMMMVMMLGLGLGFVLANAGDAAAQTSGCATPSFAAATNFGAGDAPTSITTGDFNADGKPDLATANFISNNVSVLLGDGLGGFAAANGQGFLNEPGGLRTFSFNAVTKKDGSVTGQANLHSRRSDFTAKLDVNCLNIVGNTATVSGVVKNSSNPDAIGLVALFRVTDNGEGQGNTSDQISGLYFDAADSGTNCYYPDFLLQVPIEGGNIQVKPQ